MENLIVRPKNQKQLATVEAVLGTVLKCMMTIKPVILLQNRRYFLAIKIEIIYYDLSVFLTKIHPSYI